MHARLPMRTPARLRLAAGLAAGLALAVAATGCGSQGKYTRQQVSLAEKKMSVMKSATEWEMGRQAFLAGDLDKAMKKVEASLAINDSVAKSHVLKARILIERGQMGEALSSLKMAQTLEPDSLEAHYYSGVVYERLDKPEDALRCFRTAADLDEYASQYAIAAAEMLVDLGRLQEAKDYLATRPTYEHSAGIRQTLGHIAMIEGDPRTAAVRFGEARLLSPDDTAILLDLVHAQIAAGQHREAESNLNVLLRDPSMEGRRDLRLLRARCLTRLERPVDARDIYAQLVKGDEGASDVAAWIGLAETSYAIGDDSGARKAASRVVALAPDRAEGHAVVALVERRAGEPAKALAAAERAIKARPAMPTLWVLRGVLLGDLNRYNEARAAIAHAAKLDPDNPHIARALRVESPLANVPTD